MANDLNRWEGIGRLGRDIELRYTSSGQSVVNFTLACNRTRKDPQTGQKEDKTMWMNITAWSKLAEILSQYAYKGCQLYVAGDFSEREYIDKEGNTRTTHEVLADRVQFLSGKQAEQNTPAGGRATNGANGASGNRRESPKRNVQEYDDDIPF